MNKNYNDFCDNEVMKNHILLVHQVASVEMQGREMLVLRWVVMFWREAKGMVEMKKKKMVVVELVINRGSKCGVEWI